jgi:transcriptional regulator with XRE-family HTH domain
MARTCFARRKSIQTQYRNNRRSETSPETLATGTSFAGIAIGLKIRELRDKLELTGADLAQQVNISAGLLSKIENGKVEASLATLGALARALNVPITMLLANCGEKRVCTFVPSGGGQLIRGRGIRIGHHYKLLAHICPGKMHVEPYLITLSTKAQPYTRFRHAGVEFIHVLAGRLIYRIADKTYALAPGDSLLFDAADLHGPDQLVDSPITFLSIIIYEPG